MWKTLLITTALLAGTTYANPLSAKERLEEAFKQVPTQGLNTLAVTRFYWNNVTMRPLVFDSKLDFNQQNTFLTISSNGTQNRGTIFEQVFIGKKMQAQQYDVYREKTYSYSGVGDDNKAKSAMWLRGVHNISKARIKGNITLEGSTFSIIEIASKYGPAHLLLDDSNHFRGTATYHPKTKAIWYYEVCSTVVKQGYTLNDLCHVYNADLEIVESSRLVTAHINPQFNAKDWQLSKTLKPKELDGGNPFGFAPMPADEFNLTGVRVVPPVLRGEALKAGLSIGDEIIAINGEDVTKMVFSQAEAMFWGAKKLELTIKTKKGEFKTVTMAIK